MEATTIRTDELKDIIYHKNLKIGTYWVIFSSLVLEGLNLHYVMKDFDELSAIAIAMNGLHAAMLALGAICLYFGIRSMRSSHPSWLFAAAFIGLFWALSTFNCAYFWNAPEPAARGVMLGAFTLVIGWYARPSLLLIAFPTILVAYTYVLVGYSDKTPLGMLLSILKFPALILFSLYTLRYWLSFCTEKFVENEILTEKLTALVRIDELTKVANRKGYNEAMEQAIIVSRRFKKPLSLLLFDVDYFKQYNDHLGHQAGDRCLKYVAGIIKKHARRATDTVARIGGEEFALILPSCTHTKAAKIADEIQQALANQMILHPASPICPNVTVSIGITELDDEDDSISLYRKADLALYEAKDQGRNRFVTLNQITLTDNTTASTVI